MAQPLHPAQHTALMSVYDALGMKFLFNSFKIIHIVCFLFVFSLFVRTGCKDIFVCPRFDAASGCLGSGLMCSAGNVTVLCVL